MTTVKSGHGHEEEIMGKTILVVDDDDGIRDLMEDLLDWIGYSPIICESGEHAISYINQADLLITDFNMPPGMNGAELTKIAKREKPSLPVIIITGNTGDIPANHLADQVIDKPFKNEQLEKAIADLLQTHTG